MGISAHARHGCGRQWTALRLKGRVTGNVNGKHFGAEAELVGPSGWRCGYIRADVVVFAVLD
ncbi:UNVERIFIED_CONTAM: hypothetical protein Sradi_4882300 [Sesamum radiatum]|uniref:Uncharacterized protein n=1 Tax=Sesamum radiatum TaxID=300843 RepID=A0AAW2MYY4_SESRA